MNLTSVGEINFYKGSLKVVFNRSVLNSPTSALNKKKIKKGKEKSRKTEFIRSFIIKRGSFVRFM